MLSAERTVTPEMLRAVADMRPTPPPRKPRPAANGRTEFDLEAWMEEHGVQIRSEKNWQNGRLWILEECPWNGHTDRAAFIAKFPDGPIIAGCHHNSCQGKGWRELREHYEPDAYIRENEGFIENETTDN